MNTVAQQVTLQPVRLVAGKQKSRPRQYPNAAPSHHPLDQAQASRLTRRHPWTKPDLPDQRLDYPGVIDTHLRENFAAPFAHRRSRQQQSDLLKFNQRAAEIFRVQKKHRLAVRPSTRFSISQDPSTALS